jgi:WD40 repeat protein
VIQTTNQLKKDQEDQIGEIQSQLSQLKRLRKQISSCEFTPNLDFVKKSFGSLRLFESVKSFATSSTDKTIKVWEIESGECLKTLSGHDSDVKCVIKLPDNQLASGSHDRTIKIWDLNSGSCVKTICSFFFILI